METYNDHQHIEKKLIKIQKSSTTTQKDDELVNQSELYNV